MPVSIGPRIGIDGEAEYRRQLQNIVQSTKTLDTELSNLSTTFDKNASSMSKSEKELDLARQKAEKLQEAVDQMREMMERSAEATGENSTATEKWKQKLSNAEAELAKAESAVEELESPLGQLTSTIEEQESELDSLKTAYQNAFLEYGEGSAEAEELASQIDELSSSLSENQSKLEDAQKSADGFDKSLEEVEEAEEGVGEGADIMGSMFSGAIGGMVGAIAAGDITGILSEVVEIIEGMYQAAVDYDDEMDNMRSTIAIATGASGDELRRLEIQARKTWAAVANEDFSAEQAGQIQGDIDTYLKNISDSEYASSLASAFAYYEEATDSMGSVEELRDIMQRYGLATGDAAKDTQTLVQMMGLFETADKASLKVGTLYYALDKGKFAFDALGWSIEDATGFLLSYERSGYDTSKMVGGLDQAVNHLRGKTDDLGGTLMEAFDIMASGASETEVLNTVLGDTGLTIGEVFGPKNVKDIIGAFGSGFTTNLEGVREELELGKMKMGEYAANQITTADAADLLSKHVVEQNGYIGVLYNSLGEKVPLIGALYRNQASQIEEGIKKNTENALNNIASNDQLASSYASTFDGALGHVRNFTDQSIGLLNNLKNNANVDVKVHGRFPTFTTENGLPKLTGWQQFASGYDRAMLLNGATLFGFAGGTGLIGGDRNGTEVVVGESHLLSMMTSAVRSAYGYVPGNDLYGASTTNNNTYEGATVNVYGAPGQDVKELAEIVSRQINRAVNMRRHA